MHWGALSKNLPKPGFGEFIGALSQWPDLLHIFVVVFDDLAVLRFDKGETVEESSVVQTQFVNQFLMDSLGCVFAPDARQ